MSNPRNIFIRAVCLIETWVIIIINWGALKSVLIALKIFEDDSYVQKPLNLGHIAIHLFILIG